MGCSRRRFLTFALPAAVTSVGGLSACGSGPRSRRHRAENSDDGGPKGFPAPEQTARLFQDTSRQLLDTGEWATASTKPGGVLHLPTGRLIAADPSWLPAANRLRIAPYTVSVPPGSYPLTLALLTVPGWKRVAAVKITIRDSPVVAWEMALRPGENRAALPAGQAYLVGVDIATIAVLDGSVLAEMARRSDADPHFGELKERDQVVEVIDAGSGANLIAFSTGWGDGGYPVWIGRTDSGAVGCFVVDMAMLEPLTPRTGAPTTVPAGVAGYRGWPEWRAGECAADWDDDDVRGARP